MTVQYLVIVTTPGREPSVYQFNCSHTAATVADFRSAAEWAYVYTRNDASPDQEFGEWQFERMGI